MPARLKRACRKPACPGTTTHKSGYCDKHQETDAGWNGYHQGKSRQERGYGRDWEKRRAAALARDNHLCVIHLQKGQIVAATTVDHIKPKAHGGTDAMSNLQSLCKPCHAAKTAREHQR